MTARPRRRAEGRSAPRRYHARWPPTRSVSSAIPSSSARRARHRRRRQPGRSWSTPCTRRCTRRPESGSRRRRSACSGGSSCTTSATRRPARAAQPRDRRGGGRVGLRGRVPVVARASRSRSSARSSSRCRASTSTATRSSIEGDELLGRVFLHEIDHLDGVLMLDRLDGDERKLRDARAARAGHGCADARRPPARALTYRRRVDRCASSTSALPPTRSRRCARWSTPGTTSRSSSPNPTAAGRAARGAEPSPVKQAALELGAPVRTPEKAREVVDDVAQRRRARCRRRVRPAAAGALLDAVPAGFVNMHFSLLPRWRGAAPVERAILAGDAETGVCLMRIEAGLDTGPVYAVRTGRDRRRRDRGRAARPARRGGDRLPARAPRRTLPATTPEPQVGEPTYAEKLEVGEFALDPRARPPSSNASCAPGTPGPARGSRSPANE